MYVFIGVNFQSAFGAGTPVASFPLVRREPAFRLLFNKAADGAYWLWMDGDPRWEKRRRGGGRRRRRWGDGGGEGEMGWKVNRWWRNNHVAQMFSIREQK